MDRIRRWALVGERNRFFRGEKWRVRIGIGDKTAVVDGGVDGGATRNEVVICGREAGKREGGEKREGENQERERMDSV